MRLENDPSPHNLCNLINTNDRNIFPVQYLDSVHKRGVYTNRANKETYLNSGSKGVPIGKPKHIYILNK